MADYIVFYSWQSDAPEKINKEFIQSALEKAAKELEVVPADRLTVDQGMRGVPGSPEVATMMFEKIGESGIFVGDTTLVGQIPQNGGGTKLVPNPNVSIEEGFAAGVLGWERVVCVANEHFGSCEDQPFDTRNRRFPIRYTLKPESSPQEIDAAGEVLIEDLKRAIKTIQKYDLAKAKKAREKLDLYCLEFVHKFGASYFSHPAEPNPNADTILLRNLALFDHCVIRLLELGLLHSDIGFDTGKALYAYHWTFLGHNVYELIQAKWGAPFPFINTPMRRSASADV